MVDVNEDGNIDDLSLVDSLVSEAITEIVLSYLILDGKSDGKI